MALLEQLRSYIRRRIEDGHSHKEIAKNLRQAFPTAKGLSARTVRRFCTKNNFHKTSRISNHALDVLVAYGIGKVLCVATFFKTVYTATAECSCMFSYTDPYALD